MTFPVTSVLDTFGTPGGPPPPGTWANTGRDDQNSSVVADGELQQTCGSVPDKVSIYWTTQCTADQEVYITVGSIYGVLSQSYCGLFLRLQNPTNALTIDGYLVRFLNTGGSPTVDIVSANDDSEIMAAYALPSIDAGDGLGVSIESSTITIYHKPAAGAWSSVTSTTDSSITSAGYIGIETAPVSEGE